MNGVLKTPCPHPDLFSPLCPNALSACQSGVKSQGEILQGGAQWHWASRTPGIPHKTIFPLPILTMPTLTVAGRQVPTSLLQSTQDGSCPLSPPAFFRICASGPTLTIWSPESPISFRNILHLPSCPNSQHRDTVHATIWALRAHTM